MGMDEGAGCFGCAITRFPIFANESQILRSRVPVCWSPLAGMPFQLRTEVSYVLYFNACSPCRLLLVSCRCPWSSCAGAADPTRLGHSVESRALLVILSVLPSRKQFPGRCKSKCLLLLALLIQAAIMARPRSQVDPGTVPACIYDAANTPHSFELKFDQNGMTSDLACVPEVISATADEWQKLTGAGWCGRKATSSMGLMSLWDLFLFCARSKASRNHAWHHVFQGLYPSLVEYVGKLFDGHCLFLAAGGLKPVPVLRSRQGNVRRFPRVNKRLLLERCRDQKRNRRETLGTHKDLSSKKPRLVSQEQSLEVALYMQKVVNTFAETTQIQVSWDESHFDTSTMVIAAFDHKTKAAAFLPIQQMQPVHTQELHEEIQALCFEGRAQRVDGFATIRALSHSLASIGLPLDAFRLNASLLLHTLDSEQRRVLSEGVYWIYNQD